MQLTQFTDYALRVLIYLSKAPQQFATISEISDYFDISRNHLVKIVHHLSINKVILTTRGKNGGICLAHAPKDINIGDIVRITEQNKDMVECFNPEKNNCIISPSCKLQQILHEAQQAFFETIDNYTLEDTLPSDIDFKVLTHYMRD